MDSASKKGMYETDLTYLEDKVVSAAFSWLALNLEVLSNDVPEKPRKAIAVLTDLTHSLFADGMVNVIQSSTLNNLPF